MTFPFQSSNAQKTTQKEGKVAIPDRSALAQCHAGEEVPINLATSRNRADEGGDRFWRLFRDERHRRFCKGEVTRGSLVLVFKPREAEAAPF